MGRIFQTTLFLLMLMFVVYLFFMIVISFEGFIQGLELHLLRTGVLNF